MPSDLKSAEEALRAAVDSRDYRAAAAALDTYLVSFHSAERTAEDVLRAQAICEWGIGATRNGKLRIAAGLAFLRSDPPKDTTHVCEVDG
jgi:hypothetical protein